MGIRTDCTNGTTPTGSVSEHIAANGGGKVCKPTHFDRPIPLSNTISIPYADSPAGPWHAVPQTCVGPSMNDTGDFGCPHFSNAAPLILPNGTTLLLHSGCPGAQGHGINVAL